jgi:hypothetical protein
LSNKGFQGVGGMLQLKRHGLFQFSQRHLAKYR